MKKILSFLPILFAVQIAMAQWSNTTNLFYDSLHLAVATPTGTQKNPIVVNSFPDNGFFVIWEDERNLATNKADIYAQKYDKDGNRLWAADGVPVSNGTNRQHYAFSSSQDYRSLSYAATDSAGGFYITYADDSVSSYVWERVMVQHVLASGSRVFPDPGYIISRSAGANFPTSPQLIADGNKGFFVVWKNYGDYVYAYCYRDEGGTLQPYGGGRLNDNAIQISSISPCGIKTEVSYRGTTVLDFSIWSDREQGCNVVMNLISNGVQSKMLGYNRMWRAKKNAVVNTYIRNTTGLACLQTTTYDSAKVYPLYILKSDFQNVACGSPSNVYTYTNYRLLSNGFQLIDDGAYDYNYPKGVTLGTNGNINIDMIAVTRRSYANNVVSDFTVQGYLYKSEKYTSIPFQRASFVNPELGFNPIPPAGLNTLTFLRDTLLGSGNYYPDFSLSGGGSDIYAAGVMSATGSKKVLLQHLNVTRLSDSFAVRYKATLADGKEKRSGTAIGSELSTGFGGTDISYGLPLIAAPDKGKAVFYINETGRGARVSPIGEGTDLIWGAMGIPVASGTYNGSYYNFEQPQVVLDSTGTRGLIAWRDNRNIPGNTSENIFMRHLDQLDQTVLYSPPHKRLRLLTNPYGPSIANPAIMYGTSSRFSRIDIYNNYGSDPGISPVVDIYDNNYLGRVQISAYQHTSAIRRYNNEAYLSRNYTITTDSTPPGASIDMKLYFSKQEFDALKGTDNAILDPGYLMAIRQPNTSGSINAPATYIPVAGEEILPADSWDSVGGGGYAIQVRATGFGHFFIKKMSPVTACGASATSFTSNKTSTAYTWVVKTPGFPKITVLNDDANYSGTKTATLQITNILPSFNSNLYQCLLADLSLSKTFYLQVINQWTGSVSNLWENPANWSCGKVPDASTDVILTSGTITVNSNASCHSLKVSTGATVTVTPGFSLTVVH
jgi:hypothetical protein